MGADLPHRFCSMHSATVFRVSANCYRLVKFSKVFPLTAVEAIRETVLRIRIPNQVMSERLFDVGGYSHPTNVPRNRFPVLPTALFDHKRQWLSHGNPASSRIRHAISYFQSGPD